MTSLKTCFLLWCRHSCLHIFPWWDRHSCLSVFRKWSSPFWRKRADRPVRPAGFTPRLAVVWIGFVLLAGSASAVLPPDAATRVPQIRMEYVRSAQVYEERLKQRQVEATEQYNKTKAAIYTPPWNRAAAPSAAAVVAGGTSAPVQEAAGRQRLQKWIFSIIALLFIGGAVWWVRIATEPES